MSRFQDYFKTMDAWNGAPEGEAFLIAPKFQVSGFGIEQGAAVANLSFLAFYTDGETEPINSFKKPFPIFEVNGQSGTMSFLQWPSLQVTGTSPAADAENNGECLIPILLLLADATRDTNEGVVMIPLLELIGYGGVPAKEFELCVNENYGL
jgi:hypothetical protein